MLAFDERDLTFSRHLVYITQTSGLSCERKCSPGPLGHLTCLDTRAFWERVCRHVSMRWLPDGGLSNLRRSVPSSTRHLRESQERSCSPFKIHISDWSSLLRRVFYPFLLHTHARYSGLLLQPVHPVSILSRHPIVHRV